MYPPTELDISLLLFIFSLSLLLVILDLLRISDSSLTLDLQHLSCFHSFINATLLVESDERFREERNRAFISKWLRKTSRMYDSFDLSLKALKSFFEKAKVSASPPPSPSPPKKKKSAN